MNEAAILKEYKELKEKAKKYSKKYGMLIPLTLIPSEDQWITVMERLDLAGLKIVKKGKK